MNLTTTRVILSVIVAVAGIGGAAYATGVIQKPGAGLQDKGDWITEGDGIQVKSTAYVNNPNPLGLNLSTLEASYTLKMNKVKLAEGKKEGLYVPKNKNRTINFTTSLDTENIPRWWASHLRNGESSKLRIPITASMNVGPLPLSGSYTYRDSISTDIESKLSSSLSKIEGNYSRQLGPDVSLDANNVKIAVKDAEARFGAVTTDYTELVLPLEVKNRNDYMIPTPQLNGNLKMNEVRIAEFTANNVESLSDTGIPAGETREVMVTARMSNQNIDQWFESHVRKEEKTDAELNIYFGFDIGGTTFQIPSDNGMTCRFSFATKILVDEKAETEGFKDCTGIIQEGDTGDGQNSSDGGLLGNETGGDNSSTGNSTDSGGGIGGLL